MTDLQTLLTLLADRYTVERELGHGGMATVYLARDLKHDRLVAIKVLRPELAAALGPERFLREIRLAAQLQHPHILGLFDSGESGGLLWYAMPYVPGESLRDRIEREQQLPVDDALLIIQQVAEALGYAHAQGVIHRDIKPENILLTGTHAVVADFGIARALDAAGGPKLTETGMALGTPYYMSPEQAVGSSRLDGRADIYALGCVLYEMLAGQPPFTGPTAQSILARHAVDPVPSLRTVRSTVPEAVEEAIATALAKVPADRFTTATQFVQALQATALSPRRSTSPVRQRTKRARRRWTLSLGAVILVVGSAAGWVALHPHGPNVAPAAAVIAVLPFSPSVADTALTRLGRDLVFTLSANLDNVGEIRTVDAHTVLAQPVNAPNGISLPDAAAIGRRFGAGSVVHGSVVRLGPLLVRVDFGLFTSDSLTPIARASVTASSDSVAVLTDSISRALLRQIWRRGQPPTPSLEAALKTHSPPALRAFLEGERALVEYRLSDAAESYANAIAADSTFWLPYWRFAFTKGYWEGGEIEGYIERAFQTHRLELPVSDRLSIESSMSLADSGSAALAKAREVTERFPDNWFGWLVYGDYLVHWAPILGTTVKEAAPAFERAVELNPSLVPAWEHLTWVYCRARDTAGLTRSIEALTRLSTGSTLQDAEGIDELLQFRLMLELARTDRGNDALLDSVGRANALGRGASIGMVGWCGFVRAQDRINRQILRLAPSSENTSFIWRLLSLIAAGRGAWDSVPAALDQYSRSGAPHEFPAFEGYALTVAGAWLGGLDADEASRRRPAAARMVEHAGPEDQSFFRAQLAWLDGMLAWARRDQAGLESSRRDLQAMDEGAGSDWDRSLEAFQLALTGATTQAGEMLAALEWKRAERTYDVACCQFLTALDRLAAARWLLEAGDRPQAARLLTWNEAWGGVSGSVGGGVFASIAYLERARIEEARDNTALAREYYEEFLLRYDMPAPKARNLVDEAKAALRRLSGLQEPPAQR
ncbi:MAG: serine/threonine-protein kinase [Gemmatimonadota bacterium]